MTECIKIKKLTKFKGNMVKASKDIPPQSFQILQASTVWRGCELDPHHIYKRLYNLATLWSFIIVFKLGIFINNILRRSY